MIPIPPPCNCRGRMSTITVCTGCGGIVLSSYGELPPTTGEFKASYMSKNQEEWGLKEIEEMRRRSEPAMEKARIKLKEWFAYEESKKNLDEFYGLIIRDDLCNISTKELYEIVKVWTTQQYGGPQ